MKIYDIASAIHQIDCNEWVKLQDVEYITAKVREYEQAMNDRKNHNENVMNLTPTGMTIYGKKIYHIASAISQIDCNEYVKLQDVESIIAMVRAEYVNRECVWGEGECVPDCPSCRRMDEMLKERAAGDREGQRDMLNRCIAAVKAIENDFNSSAEWDRDYDVDPSGNTRNPRIWIREAVSALNSLEVRS